MKPYFDFHLFVCCNQRPNNQPCCNNHDATSALAKAKEHLKNKPIAQRRQARVNLAGCLGRCDEGPVAVVYPQAQWYRYERADDLIAIIDSHLTDESSVDHLRLP